MRFEGRVAFITGASRGVGKTIALALAREGCDVVVAAKSIESTERLPGSIHDTAAEIEALGRRALPLRVDVRDNGPGVRPQDRDVIFDKFRQAGDTLTEKPHGTGLGLPISRHIVERHGGQIWVENHAGPGACFSFKLPVLKLAEAA